MFSYKLLAVSINSLKQSQVFMPVNKLE